MIREKPRLDRARVLREEALQRQVAHLLEQVTAELSPGERLGVPVRAGDRIIIPVEAAAVPARGDQEAEAVRLLVSVWLDELPGQGGGG